MGVWTLRMRFDGDDKEYSAGILEDATIKECVGAKGKHAMQSCSVSILDRTLAAMVFNSSKDIDAKICNGNTVMFEGVIRPYAKLSAEMAHENPIELEVIDYTQVLHCYVYTDLSEIKSISQSVKDKCIQTFTASDISISDLIEKLFTLTGITDKVSLVIPELESKKQYFVLEAGAYVDEVIEELLYEYCLDYRFSPGTLTVYSTKVVNADSTPIAATQSLSSFNLSFTVKREDVSEDGVSISYGDYHTGRYKIYSESGKWKLETWWDHPELLKKGYYYNRGVHSTLDDYTTNVPWSFPSDLNGKTVVSVYGVEAKVTFPYFSVSACNAYCTEYDKDGGKPYIRYGELSSKWVGKIWGFNIEVYANVVYRDSSLKYEQMLGLNPTKITTDYIETAGEARLLCANVQARNERSAYKYEFSTRTSLVPGSIVRISEDKVTGLVTDVRITSRTYNPLTLLYSYEAEGAGTVSIPVIFSGYNATSTPEEVDENSHLISLSSTKNSFIVEEADTEFTVTALGLLFSVFGCSPLWSFNGETQSEEGLTLTLKKSLLKIGANTVKCSTLYDGQTYESSITIALVQASVDLSSSYEWTVTDTIDAPASRETFFAFDDYLMSYDDYYIVLDDTWTSEMPGVSADQFLWLRIPASDGSYSVIRMTGNPYQDFSIYADPATYINSKRLSTDRTVTIGVSYGNLSSPTISYQLVGSPEGVMQVMEDGVGTNVFKILAGQTPDSFTVEVIVVGVGSKTLTIQGVGVSENSPMYLGRSTDFPIARSDIRMLDGDWFLYVGSDEAKYGHVYAKDGDSWAETTDSKKLSEVYWDTADLQTQNIYARVVFAQSILAEEMTVLGKFTFEKEQDDKLATLEISQQGLVMRFGDKPVDTDSRPYILNANFADGSVYIGNYAAGNGILWSGIDSTLYIRGKGNFEGQLDTITLRTELGDETEYSLGSISSLQELGEAIAKECSMNFSIEASGTLYNGKAIGKMSIENLLVEQMKIGTAIITGTSGGYVFTNICTLGITIKDTDGISYRYVIRKIKGSLNGYPSLPRTLAELVAMADFSAPVWPESMYAKIGEARSYPGNITDLSYYDTTKERLYIKNLPSAEPSESTRVWADEEGYLRIVK